MILLLGNVPPTGGLQNTSGNTVETYCEFRAVASSEITSAILQSIYNYFVYIFFLLFKCCFISKCLNIVNLNAQGYKDYKATGVVHFKIQSCLPLGGAEEKNETFPTA
jgi:benzoyl-CoA reductase/2-hydroxyglutaryl-CoA dehydratase subunit BcrC/BadD/HgdB